MKITSSLVDLFTRYQQILISRAAIAIPDIKTLALINNIEVSLENGSNSLRIFSCSDFCAPAIIIVLKPVATKYPNIGKIMFGDNQ